MIDIGEASKKIISSANTSLGYASNFKIATDSDYSNCEKFVGEVKKRKECLVARRKKITDPIDVAKKSSNAARSAAMDFFREPIEQFESCEAIYKKIMLRYIADKAKILTEEREESEKIAENERQKFLEVAEKHTANGDTRAAEVMLDMAACVRTQIPVSKKILEKSSVREEWHAELVDLERLVKAVAEGNVPLDALIPNHKFLDSKAKALKEELKYPGVNPVMLTTMAIRK